VHVSVSSRLDYCNGLLYDVNDGFLKKLQIVHNTAMRVVTEARKFNHTSQVLLELNWLPIRHRITCKLMTIVYQCLHGLEPMTACLSQLWRTDGISGMLTVIVPRRGPIFTNIVFKIHPQMCHKIILRQKL